MNIGNNEIKLVGDPPKCYDLILYLILFSLKSVS